MQSNEAPSSMEVEEIGNGVNSFSLNESQKAASEGNPGAMITKDSNPNQPTYNTNYGHQAQAPPHNGYPGYAPPPPYGYYNPNHPSQVGSAPPANAPYGYYPPPPSYNNGYYDPRFYHQAPVRRSPKPKAPAKPKAARSSPKNVSYKVAGNRVSGNTGDHNGVFNVGNKNSGGRVDDDDEDEY